MTTIIVITHKKTFFVLPASFNKCFINPDYMAKILEVSILFPMLEMKVVNSECCPQLIQLITFCCNLSSQMQLESNNQDTSHISLETVAIVQHLEFLSSIDAVICS